MLFETRIDEANEIMDDNALLTLELTSELLSVLVSLHRSQRIRNNTGAK